MEKGIEDEEDNLYKQSEEVADNVLDNLDKTTDYSSNKSYQNNSSRYIFNMNVYPQKLDEQELDNLFNYVNKRFGTLY